MTPKSPESIKEEFLSVVKEDSVDLFDIAHFVKRNRDSMIPLVKPRGSTLRICGQDGTVYEGDAEQLEAWKDYYLPERMEMEVIGAIDDFPCDAFGLQLVLLLGEDGRVFAYEDELLHLVARNLRDLFQCEMAFPGTKTFKLGECFEEPTEEEYHKMMESDEVKEMEKLHIEFRQSLENELLNIMRDIAQSRNVHMHKQVGSKKFTSSSKQTIQEHFLISKMEKGDKLQSPYRGFHQSSHGHSPDVQTIKKKCPKMAVKKKGMIEDNEEKEELSEVEEKNHIRSGEKPKQKDLKKRRVKKSFTCTQCGKSFTYKRHLELHMRVHTGEKPFTCYQCGKCFTRLSTLKDHMDIHTGGKRHSCDQCAKTFLWASVLRTHMKVHTKEKPHSCYLCGKSFSLLHSLKVHQKIHTGVKEYLCFECEKTFTSANCLKLHERIHTGEKPYKCSHCDKRFNQSTHLKTHKSIHTGEKPYKCSHCDKRFRLPGTLKIHERIHTGEKQYHCTACGKHFNQSSALRTHEKNYHSK